MGWEEMKKRDIKVELDYYICNIRENIMVDYLKLRVFEYISIC